MEDESMERMSEYKEELFFSYKEKEREFRERVKEAEIFGMMEKSVDVAVKLIGLLEDEIVAEVTGLHLEHVLSLHR